MRILLLAVVLFLQGCATIGKPETFTACTVADTATTILAVKTGIAHEVNPLLSGSVNAHHFLPLVLSKLVVIGLIYWIYDAVSQPAAETGVAAASLITCGVAANNAWLLLK